ncbi:MAG: hypothetical protein WAM70_17690, partial [Pyrinomonadaceae bacterium]
GTIDNGTELFGNYTPQPNHLLALTRMDFWPWLNSTTRRMVETRTPESIDRTPYSPGFGFGKTRITTASPNRVKFTRSAIWD